MPKLLWAAIILAAALFHAVHASTVSSIFGSGSGALGFFNLALLGHLEK